MIKKIIRIVLISVIPLYLLGALFALFNKRSQEVCKEVRISIQDSINTPFLKQRDVELALQRNKISPVGKLMSEINTYEIGRLLEDNKIIREAVCYKTPDGTLRIDVYQRNPILRVMGVNGNYYIDDEGLVMPVSYHFTAHLPIATGYVTKEIVDGGLFHFALFLEDNSFWKMFIEQIHVLSNGDIELIPKIGDFTILLGDFTNFDKKLDNLMLFFEKGATKRGWNVYKTINIKYENQVICTKN